ncbi:MAG: DUF6468 domain-containing protein [Rhodospirillales bacterium]
MIWTLFLDGLVAALLVVAIVLAMILNRRFAGLARDRMEFASVAQEFNAALARAEGSVACLKTTTAGLEAENKRAEAHEEDLRQLIERAEGVCDRLEAAVRATRPQATVTPMPVRTTADPAPGQQAGPTPVAVPRSEAERDLLQALRFKR